MQREIDQKLLQQGLLEQQGGRYTWIDRVQLTQGQEGAAEREVSRPGPSALPQGYMTLCHWDTKERREISAAQKRPRWGRSLYFRLIRHQPKGDLYANTDWVTFHLPPSAQMQIMRKFSYLAVFLFSTVRWSHEVEYTEVELILNKASILRLSIKRSTHGIEVKTLILYPFSHHWSRVCSSF